jgi:iron complex outermembrane recepter protein
MLKSVTFRSTLIALACAASFAAHAVAEPPRQVDVSAGELTTALRELARQSGVEFIYSAEQLKGVRTNGVQGEYTAEKAVTKLLEGTKLRLTVHKSGALLISDSGTRPGSAVDSLQRTPRTSARAYASSASAVQLQLAQAEQDSSTTPASASTESSPTSSNASELDTVIVSGQRESLAAAAQVKKNADQVVDSLVAEDIGKFPDTTVAAALRRIPGVQVEVSRRNEMVLPVIRGLNNVVTTINGREVFTGTGRSFAFEVLPADALARADVYKSNSADLIEGGLAGTIDLKLRYPLDMPEGTTASAQVRGIYGEMVDKTSATASGVISHRWNSDRGEFGALLGASWQHYEFSFQLPHNGDPIAVSVPGSSVGMIMPAVIPGENDHGDYTRPEVNLALQWRLPSGLELYLDGIYAADRANRYVSAGILGSGDLPSPESISDVTLSDNCENYQAGPNGRYSPTGTVGQYCRATSVTLTGPNLVATDANGARDEDDTYALAGGVKWGSGPWHGSAEVSWIRSITTVENAWMFLNYPGESSVVLQPSPDLSTVPKAYLSAGSLTDVSAFRLDDCCLFNDYRRNYSTLEAVRLDGSRDLAGGFFQELQAGVRFADRQATTNFWEDVGTPSEEQMDTPISDLGLGDDFLEVAHSEHIPNFVAPSPEWLQSSANQATIRQLFGLSPEHDTGWDPTRGFDIGEQTSSAYLQTKYRYETAGKVTFDGLIGARYTATKRDLTGTGTVITDGVATLVPVSRSTNDSDVLPNASLRVMFTDDLLMRLSYAKTIARPGFGLLNPSLNYTVPTGPGGGLGGASGGNPDLKPQSADAYDLGLEYYFGSNSYIGAALYRKDVKDRAITQTELETINGVDYLVSRPRNLGSVVVQGVEVGGQYFMDSLPGFWSGFGLMANYTIADSEVTTPGDPLEGQPLLGVSKHSYNAGLLYEKYGLTARAVYSYRSEFNVSDVTSVPWQRPVGTELFWYKTMPWAQLDVSFGYQVNENFTLSLDGMNLTRSRTRTAYAPVGFPAALNNFRFDETSYSVGVRVKF